MARFEDSTFKNTTVALDGNEHIRCKFIGAKIIVTRGNFKLNNCAFDSCSFEFGGEAENIKNLVLSLVNQAPVPAGRKSNG